MGQRRKPGGSRESAADQETRDQEVLRANRELAAYFRGRRTEREARGALKIIKAFVRDRERRDAKSRPPLAGAAAAKTQKAISTRPGVSDRGERHRRKLRRKPHDKLSQGVTASIQPPVKPDPQNSPDSDERTPGRFDKP